MSEFFNYIFLIGAAQSFLLSFFLFKKKENHLANLILGFILLAFGLDLLEVFYVSSKLYLKYPEFMGLTFGFPYLYGAGVYLFVVVLGKNLKSFPKIYYLHFLPYLIVLGLCFIFLFFEPPEYKIGLLNNTIDSAIGSTISLLIPFYGLFYVLLTIRETVRINNRLKSNYSNIDSINLNWILTTVIGATAIWLVVFISYILQLFNENAWNDPGYYIYISISIFVYYLGYKSLIHPEIILAESNENKDNSYSKSGLSEEDAEKYLKLLTSKFQEESLFKRSDIKLSDLANLLGMSSHNLSEVLNKKLGKNFYDFVNSYRIEFIKSEIEKGALEKFSLLTLAYDAGFKSKSTFNTTFKKIVGMTPTEYKRSVNK